ncbi:MAG: DUF3105 domain-containing protein, partial [Solirubrobacteraceae bacterium]
LTRALERLVVVVVSVAIAVGIIALLSGGLLAGRDDPGVSAGQAGPGTFFAGQGDAYLQPGQSPPRYDSDPPTSGPHVPVPVTRDESELTNDQLLQSLSSGDIVLMYGSREPPPELRRLAASAAPAFSPALAASGQAVILARRSGIAGVIGLAWTHMLRVDNPADPALRNFVQFWLGRGAPAH